MTLAIGMHCEGGLVFVADRRVSYADGSVAEMYKLTAFGTDEGMFAIAQSSHDANAANSLVRNIQHAIQNRNSNIEHTIPMDFELLEIIIEQELQKWYVPVHDNRPTVHLLVGVCLFKSTALFRHRLYFCEPPNTVIEVDSRYKAIGDAWVITDPIYNQWLNYPGLHSPHSRLCCMSYLMYKAKQLMPGAVGGQTDAFIICEDPNLKRYFIESRSMATAEAVCGPMFDQSVSKFSSLVMEGDSRGTQAITEIATNIYQTSLNYSRLEFRCDVPSRAIINREFCI